MNERLIQLVKRLHFGIVLGVLATIYIGYYLVVTIKHNYDLRRDIAALQHQIDDLQIERDQLKYRIQYYQTDAYKEKEARAKLNMQAPGEGVIILPEEDLPKADTNQKKTKPKKSNFRQWIDFLTGRLEQ